MEVSPWSVYQAIYSFQTVMVRPYVDYGFQGSSALTPNCNVKIIRKDKVRRLHYSPSAPCRVQLDRQIVKRNLVNATS